MPAVLKAWSCRKIQAPCAPSSAFAKDGDGNMILQLKYRRFSRERPWAVVEDPRTADAARPAESCQRHHDPKNGMYSIATKDRDGDGRQNAVLAEFCTPAAVSAAMYVVSSHEMHGNNLPPPKHSSSFRLLSGKPGHFIGVHPGRRIPSSRLRTRCPDVHQV